MAVHINASAQRKSAFEEIQEQLVRDPSCALNQKLQLIMDVSTRWDSTCMMLIRAVRLRKAISQYCIENSSAKPFTLRPSEWKQIEYLIDLVRSFNFFTQTVGKTRAATLPYALSIYDELYERLAESRRRILAK